MRTILFVFIFIISISNSFAQKLDHILGEVIVEVRDDNSVDLAIQNIQTKNRFQKIEKKKLTSLPMNLWVLKVDAANNNEIEFLDDLKKDKNILLAQQNHLTNYRSTEPNDPDFINQWQYINLGQDGGVQGADIDMDLAWDISTGGTTSDGDEIVVCVIDDGIINNHEDWGDNLWINEDEIPEDGIDNDGNGYIDDIRGWHAINDNDNVYQGGGHGSPVAGVIGAKGNNGVGVAGVNWDVKLMIVVGGSPESVALASYAYSYNMRKIYNDTNGEKGAFVVSTNASWGIDGGQPEDAPIWCDFYNLLGEEGILNFGATANRNFNIDEVGDLPTGCDSDFLISVTNIERDDEKRVSAGFGLRTIDLGAFGHETFTISGMEYGGFGGTSGATPHVAGAAALMYSVDCPEFMALVKENPSEGALVIRDYILNGVDPNESLLGITTTGGRLNVFNSMLKINGYCSDCVEIGGIRIGEISLSDANIFWPENENIGDVSIRYRLIDTNDWIELSNIENGHTIINLDPCAHYEYQVKSKCNDIETEYSYTRVFETEGCCLLPENIDFDLSEDNILNMSWDNVSNAGSYIIETRQSETDEWIAIEVEGNIGSNILQIQDCETVEVRLRTKCNIGVPESVFTEPFTVSGNCDACTQDYCEFGDKDTSDEWIGGIEIDGVLNYEGMQVDGGYTNNFNSLNIVFHTGTTYGLILSPEFSGQPFQESFIVGIDFNHDAEFSDDEIVFESTETSSEGEFGEITIPTDALLGITRMRVVMRFNNPATICDSGFTFGDVVDFCVSINEINCPTNFDAIIQDSTENSLIFEISDDGRVDEYIIGYRTTLSEEFVEVTSQENTITIEGLEQCTEYEFYSSVVCDGARVGNSDVNSEKTKCISNTNETFSNSVVLYPNPTSGILYIDVDDNFINEISVFNHYGQKLKSIDTNFRLEFIDIAHLNPGIYFIRLTTDEADILKKVVVQ